MSADTQTHAALEGIADQGHVAEIRQEAPLRLDLRVTDKVANQGVLARKLASAGHGDLQLAKIPVMAENKNDHSKAVANGECIKSQSRGVKHAQAKRDESRKARYLLAFADGAQSPHIGQARRQGPPWLNYP